MNLVTTLPGKMKSSKSVFCGGLVFYLRSKGLCFVANSKENEIHHRTTSPSVWLENLSQHLIVSTPYQKVLLWFVEQYKNAEKMTEILQDQVIIMLLCYHRMLNSVYVVFKSDFTFTTVCNTNFCCTTLTLNSYEYFEFIVFRHNTVVIRNDRILFTPGDLKARKSTGSGCQIKIHIFEPNY